MQKIKSLMGMPKHSYEHVPKPSQPQPMAEVQIVSNAGKLLDKYREVYKARYGNEAVIIDTQAAGDIMTNLCNKVGIQRALELVEHFLRMDPASIWFLNGGHSISILKNKIEEINASFSVSVKRTIPDGEKYDPMIRFETQCPRCEQFHEVTCRGSEMGKNAYTMICNGCVNR